MAPLSSLSVLWLCGQLVASDVNGAAVTPTPGPAPASELPAEKEGAEHGAFEHVATPAVPHYRADVGVDIGADTFLFHHGQTAFELELSPRISFILHPAIDAGFYAAAGYGGPIHEWSQLTTFGVGPFINFLVPLGPQLSLNPWLGVMYHYGFIEGFTGSANERSVLQFPQQSVRVDLHADCSFGLGQHTALNVGPFFKARLAPVSEGPGTAAQLAYGLRVSAVTAF